MKGLILLLVKLLRECKDTIDGLVNNLKNANGEAMSYMIQITGSSYILSMHLALNGLYVAKHRHTFSIPHRFDDLSSLLEALAQLLNNEERASNSCRQNNQRKKQLVDFLNIILSLMDLSN